MIFFLLLGILNFVEFVECKWYSFNLDDGKNGEWMSKAVFPDCVGLEISKDHEKIKCIIDLTSLHTFFFSFRKDIVFERNDIHICQSK